MAQPWRTPDWEFKGLEHGFAPRSTPVPTELKLVRANQVHGARILVVDKTTPVPAGEADGLITRAPGVAVAIATADCVPILLAAPQAKIVAAVHAGWRGSLAGIAPRAIELFAELFQVEASSIQAALGPSIGGCCYEIERDIAKKFADKYGEEAWTAWYEGSAGKGNLDLREMNRILLLRAGMSAESIHRVGPCTGCGSTELASYRVEGPGTGRQLSWIGLER